MKPSQLLIPGLFLGALILALTFHNGEKAMLALTISPPAWPGVSSTVNPAQFFAAGDFVSKNGSYFSAYENDIYPYDVEEDWLAETYEASEGNGDWDAAQEDINTHLKTDYVLFDPLVLLKNNPEQMVENFKGTHEQEVVSLAELQRMQELWNQLTEMEALPKTHQPSAASATLSIPSGFMDWDEEYAESSADTIIFQNLLYVDIKTWELTTEALWKNYDESEEWGFIRYALSPLAYAQNSDGTFYLSGTLKQSNGSSDGGSGQDGSLIRSYDALGRIQDSFLVAEYATYELPMLEYEKYLYNSEGRLERVERSQVTFESNQLYIPRLAYEKYVWKAE